MKGIKSYSVLSTFDTLEARYDYLKLGGRVGKQTFGWDRYFNQRFYHSTEWKAVRNHVIVRDGGCDLGVPGFEINDSVLIHHMNPIWIDDLRNHNPEILDPEFLVCVSRMTHQAIHYGDRSLLPEIPVERRPGDTLLWKANGRRRYDR